MRQSAKNPDSSHFLNRSLCVGTRIPNKCDAEDRNPALPHSLQRQQGVVDRSEPGAGTEDNGNMPARENIGESVPTGKRNEQATSPFDDERQACGWRMEGSGIEYHTIVFR